MIFLHKLCISAYVFGEYTRYIPYYIYSIIKSYPEYTVKIFVHDFLSKKEKTCLNMLKSKYPSHFEIIENYRNKMLSYAVKTEENRTLLTTLRWLIPSSEFEGFDYAYIGDIDYLIIKEEPGILQGHIEHCKKTGLPYSNMIRKESRRLTGLHFFEVKSYYEKMKNIIDYYYKNISELQSLIKQFNESPNEAFLYLIVSQNIGIIEEIKHGKELQYRPEHGFHLGNIRAGIIRRDGYLHRYAANPHLIQYCYDDIFYRMLNILPVKEIIYLFKHLVKKPNFTMKNKIKIFFWDIENALKYAIKNK